MATPSANGIPHYTLIDFGRACDAEREKDRRENKDKKSLRGSIHYMAPEQFTNGVLDPRTDLYALGAMAYEFLTGEKPFDGDNTIQVMSAHLTGRVEPIQELLPELPPGMAPWIMALISKNPDARPPNRRRSPPQLPQPLDTGVQFCRPHHRPLPSSRENSVAFR